MDLDSGDKEILKTIQGNGRISNQELADKLNMSPSPCWRRLRRLEDIGLITEYRALLDRKKLGFGVLAFIQVQIDSHSEIEAESFEREVSSLPEVIACYSIAGGADFLLQIVSEDLDSYADFAMHVVRRLPRIKAMQTMFVLKEIKPPSALPIR